MNESPKMEQLYAKLYSKYESSNSETELKELGVVFNSLADYKDCKKMAVRCFRKAEECRKNAIYDKAMQYFYEDNIESYNKAVSDFYSIHPWKDTGKKIKYCNDRMFKIRSKQKQELFQREKQLKNMNKPFRISDTVKIIFIGTIVACFVLFFVYFFNLFTKS